MKKKKIVDGRTFDGQGQGVERKEKKRGLKKPPTEQSSSFLIFRPLALAQVHIAQTLELSADNIPTNMIVKGRD